MYIPLFRGPRLRELTLEQCRAGVNPAAGILHRRPSARAPVAKAGWITFRKMMKPEQRVL